MADVEVRSTVDGAFDAAIVLECGSVSRTELSGLERYFVINIDHHLGNTMYGDLNFYLSCLQRYARKTVTACQVGLRGDLWKFGALVSPGHSTASGVTVGGRPHYPIGFRGCCAVATLAGRRTARRVGDAHQRPHRATGIPWLAVD